MNRREDFLEPYRTYLGIPFRDEMLPPLIDDLSSAEMDINSEAISDIDLPSLDTDVEDIEGYFSEGNLINDVINDRIDTSSKYILSDFDFGTTDYSGGLKFGDITWNSSTGAVTGGSGAVINRSGFLGAKAGSTTFSIDTNGDATFAGDLAAATGTFGITSIASGGHIKQGQTAYDTGTGFWLGDDSGTTKLSIGNSSGDRLTWNGSTLSIKGDITIDGGSGISNLTDAGSLATKNNIGASDCNTTIISGGKIITGLLTASNIQTGTLNASLVTVDNLNASNINTGTLTGITITGNTIQTATTGRRIRITTDQYIRWYNGADLEAYMFTDSGGDLEIDADNTVSITATGSEDFVGLYAGGTVYSQGKNVVFSATNNWQINDADAIIMNYNKDSDGSFMTIDEDGGNMAEFDTGKDALFRSDLECVDQLSKGSGSFKIDHPLKPKTHYLYHSFVESPEMLNIYKGRGKIKNGKYIIELPDYFEALNKDVEYNLTPIGKKATLWIKKEIKNLKVEVAGDVDCEFSWVIYGVRQDKYALANPINVEEEKIVEGYLHPELYGEKQAIWDKIISENWRRKKKGLKPYPNHNRKGYVKFNRKSKIDKDVKEEMDNKNSKRKNFNKII